MADFTKIEWTEATWNIITGCSVKSPGCAGCYAMKLAGSRLQHHPSRAGLTMPSKAGPVWNGQVRFNEEWLTQPLQWKRPRMIFVCAHGDLFHESVPDAWIDRVFAVMALAPQHTFQVLTKRSARMREYLCNRTRLMSGTSTMDALSAPIPRACVAVCQRIGSPFAGNGAFVPLETWPLPNVWLGVSVEDQKRADERIPDLLATPAAVRWISAEPLLGPVDLGRIDLIPWLNKGKPAHEMDPRVHLNALSGLHSIHPIHGVEQFFQRGLDWVVVGGESGSGARPMHPDWARSLRDQCATAGVPFFFKQWGEFRAEERPGVKVDLRKILTGCAVAYCGKPGHHMLFTPVGKKASGRLLDGIEHNGMPGVP